MNFYQKVYAIITLLILAITAIILFVGFSSPYSAKFIAESAAIMLSEVIFGISLIAACSKKDSILLFSTGYSVSSFLYFLFTLLMAFAVNSSLGFRHFIVIHIVGFLIAIILILFYFMAEHNFQVQESTDSIKKQGLLDLRNAISEIKIKAQSVFADKPVIIEEINVLADDFRYAADPSEKTEKTDAEIISALDELNKELECKDGEKFQMAMTHLKTLFQIRKNIK